MKSKIKESPQSVLRLREFQSEFYEAIKGGNYLTKAGFELRVRELRLAGLVEVYGRGPHARTITFEEAARVVLAVAGAQKAREVPEAVKIFSEIEQIEGNVTSPKRPEHCFLGQRKFIDLITHVLSDPGASSKISFIRIFQSRPGAEVITTEQFGGGERKRFLYVPLTKSGNGLKKGADYSSLFEPSWQIRGYFFQRMAELLRDGPPTGGRGR